MNIKIRKCGECGAITNNGKYWGTGIWLCNKCYNKYDSKHKKLRGSMDESVAEKSVSGSTIKKIKKGRKRNLKRVKTKLHKDGFQNRLTQYIGDD